MGKTKEDPLDAARGRLRQIAKDSGMTLQDIGLRMGFSPSGARQAVSRLLNRDVSYDPRLSTLIAFAKAVEKPLKDIL
jgi:transcriptional regulator with XRE-family HTH domain